MARIRTQPFELIGRRGRWGGPSLPLDLRMLEMIALDGPIEGECISSALWPGATAREAAARLSAQRRLLRQRAREELLLKSSRGWQVKPGCLEDWPAPRLGPEPDMLRETLRLAGPAGISARSLSLKLGISQESLRKRISRARREKGGERLASGCGGYRLLY